MPDGLTGAGRDSRRRTALLQFINLKNVVGCIFYMVKSVGRPSEHHNKREVTDG